MLRLYHFAGALAETDQLLEPSQRLTARERERREANYANNARIEHPLRNLQQPRARTRIKTALENRESTTRRSPQNADRSTMPWMPRVPHLTEVDAMGVTLPSCTTITDRIAGWGTRSLAEYLDGATKGTTALRFSSSDRT